MIEPVHIPRAAYMARVGQPLGTSPWIEVTQDRIDQFAACTGDDQYIHTDPDRTREGPFGGTIAQGFLTLSMIAEMMRGLPRIEGLKTTLNYGFDRVRFLSPVPVGSRLRGHFVLEACSEIGPDVVETIFAIEVQMDGHDKPAVVALWRARRYF